MRHSIRRNQEAGIRNQKSAGTASREQRWHGGGKAGCPAITASLVLNLAAMTSSRRDFVRIAGTATAAALLSSPTFGANEPALGLIFPPKDYPIPPDAKRLYPSGVEFLGDGVGLPGGMTIQGYEEAIPRVVPVAEALAKRGAKVISVFGSSLTFYKGRQFHEELMQRVTKATGVK